MTTSWHVDQEETLDTMRILAEQLPPIIRQMVVERIDGYAKLVSDLIGPPRDGTSHETAEKLIDELYDELLIIPDGIS